MKLTMVKGNIRMGNVTVQSFGVISTFIDLDICIETKCLTHLIVGDDKRQTHIGSAFMEKSGIGITDLITEPASLEANCKILIGGICVSR
jgi:hypothetical protein